MSTSRSLSVFVLLCLVYQTEGSNWLQKVLGVNDDETRFTGELAPVVIIPGLMSTRLESRRHDKDHWHGAWMSPRLITRPFKLLMRYNSTSRQPYNYLYELRHEGRWGSTEPFERLNNAFPFKFLSKLKIFDKLVKKMKRIGYQESETLFGAPYDWRLAPNTMDEFYTKLKALIEEAQSKNATPVTLICHSMGCSHIHYFLTRRVSADWKNTNVRRLISAAGVYGGTVRPLQFFTAAFKEISTFDFLDGLQDVFEDNVVIPVAKSWPSVHFLLPAEGLWKPDETLVQIGETKYSLSNLHEFYKLPKLQMGDRFNLYEDVKNLMNYTDPIGVDTHLFYGTGMKTLKTLEFTEAGFPDEISTAVVGDGDSIVNLRSLRVPITHWHNPVHKVTEKGLPGVGHQGILKSSEFINNVVSILQED